MELPDDGVVVGDEQVVTSSIDGLCIITHKVIPVQFSVMHSCWFPKVHHRNIPCGHELQRTHQPHRMKEGGPREGGPVHTSGAAQGPGHQGHGTVCPRDLCGHTSGLSLS